MVNKNTKEDKEKKEDTNKFWNIKSRQSSSVVSTHLSCLSRAYWGLRCVYVVGFGLYWFIASILTI